jgi:DNA repair protein RecN (Recombination protein N)
MLSFLSIQNYVLIRHLEIDFGDGLSVITGETGAGKSILLGALNLILGKRADTKVLLDKSKKCIIEGTFSIGSYHLSGFFEKHDLDYDDQTILRREVNKNGKSRAFINDTPVNLNVLRDLGEKLIDIHSQDETQTLNESAFQLAIIDSYAGINDSVSEFRNIFSKYNRVLKELNEMTAMDKKNKSEMDYFQFLFDELNDARLEPNEQIELEEELEVLKHAEEIKGRLLSSSELMDSEQGLLAILTEMRNNLGHISKYGSKLEELHNRLESAYIELNDIQTELQRAGEAIEHSPARIEEIDQRLNTIYQLQTKHRVSTVEALVNLKEELSNRLNDISSLENKIERLQKELLAIKKELDEKSLEISINRENAIPQIEKKVISILSQLGMPNAQLKIQNKKLEEPGKDGIDSIQYLFNANKGGTLNELSKVASGGEKSRLMLALKSLISVKNLLPTVVFDEIDLGVSGAIADKVGDILRDLGKSMQVIAITHLPQIAGKGANHYLVYKETETDQTITRLKKLVLDERTVEIAKMVSGQEVTSASFETAKNLLEN